MIFITRSYLYDQSRCFYNQSFHCNEWWLRAAEVSVVPFNVSKHYLPTLTPAPNISFKNSKSNALEVTSFTYRLVLSEEAFGMLYLDEKPSQTSLFLINKVSKWETSPQNSMPTTTTLSQFTRAWLSADRWMPKGLTNLARFLQCICSGITHPQDWHTKGM